jgi:hypothetical protein
MWFTLKFLAPYGAILFLGLKVRHKFTLPSHSYPLNALPFRKRWCVKAVFLSSASPLVVQQFRWPIQLEN